MVGGVGLLVAIVVSMAATTASAAVVEYASLSDLVELSDVAVRGEVVRRHSFYSDTQERIVTHTTIEVQKHYIGETPERIRIEQWGGRARGRTVRVPGDASFETDQDVIVFLRSSEQRPEDLYFLTSLAQSKYTVRDNGETRLVSRDLSGMTFREADSDETFRLEGRVQTLETFEGRLETAVAASEEGGEP